MLFEPGEQGVNMRKPARTYEWKDAAGLTLAAQTVMAINVGLLAVSAIVWLWLGETASYADLPDDGGAMFTAAQFVRWAIDVLMLLGMLCAAVVISLWLVRVSKNAHVLQPAMKYGPLGAVGWYCVPIAWWIKPYEAFSEIWLVSSTEESRRTEHLLAPWWGAFLLSIFLSFGQSTKPPSLAIAFNLAAAACSAAATVLFFILAGRLNRAQTDKHDRWIAAGAPPARTDEVLPGLSQGAW